MKLRASRRGRDGEDIANLLALLDVTTTEQAEALYESYFPGEVLEQKAFLILDDIFAFGLPPMPVTPPPPVLG